MATKKNTVHDAVQALRERIAELHGERARLLELRYSKAELEAHIAALVARWHADADRQLQRDLFDMMRGDSLRADLLRSDVTPERSDRYAEALLGPSLALMVGEEALMRRFREAIEKLPADGATPEERKLRVAQIGEELDRLEAREEELIVQSEAEATPILRRADARPEIVLALPEGAEPQQPVTLPRKGTPDPDMPRSARSPYIGTSRP